ncbi:36059_t:CDS:2, partial [Gigaspora margarita]
MLDVVLEKVKVHSEDKHNERANRIAKEGGKANVPIRVKRVMTEKAWAKKEEEILDSIKEELKQKEKIDLEEYRNQHIEWSRRFLADDVGLALERLKLSKNKAQDTAMTFLDKWLTFFQKE